MQIACGLSNELSSVVSYDASSGDTEIAEEAREKELADPD